MCCLIIGEVCLVTCGCLTLRAEVQGQDTCVPRRYIYIFPALRHELCKIPANDWELVQFTK